MDFVIAIDVQGKLYNNEELDGIIEVLEQVGSFQNALYFARFLTELIINAKQRICCLFRRLL
mgnify:CR=1 FL=1